MDNAVVARGACLESHGRGASPVLLVLLLTISSGSLFRLDFCLLHLEIVLRGCYRPLIGDACLA